MMSRLLSLLLAGALVLSAVPLALWDHHSETIRSSAVNADRAVLGEGMDEAGDKRFAYSLRADGHGRAMPPSSVPAAATHASLEGQKAVRHDLRLYTLDRTLRI